MFPEWNSRESEVQGSNEAAAEETETHQETEMETVDAENAEENASLEHAR